MRAPTLKMLAMVGCLLALAGIASAQETESKTASPSPSPSPPPVCKPYCKPGWEVVPYYGTDCQYACLSPVKLSCVSKYLPYKLWQNVYQPYLCGGTTDKMCPTISCTYTSTYSVAGPEGCAFAKSVIKGTSLSKTAFDYKPAAEYALKSFCYEPSAEKLEDAVYAAANAYAVAVAKTMAQWNVYVCNCGCGTLSANYAEVAADLQSVAIAMAKAYAEAFVGIESDTCYGEYASVAMSYVEALSKSTQLAIDAVYKKYVYAAPGSQYYKKCASTGVQTEIEKAVAYAAACTFANVYAVAYNNYYDYYGYAPGNNVAYSCGTSISIAQFGITCPYNIGCDLKSRRALRA